MTAEAIGMSLMGAALLGVWTVLVYWMGAIHGTGLSRKSTIREPRLPPQRKNRRLTAPVRRDRRKRRRIDLDSPKNRRVTS